MSYVFDHGFRIKWVVGSVQLVYIDQLPLILTALLHVA